MLAALAANEGASIAQLARIAGASESRVSTHLTKMAERGLTVSPMCVPGRSWALTGNGREIVMAAHPLIDDTDRQVLAALAVTSMGSVKLARRTGVCLLTAKRRARLLAARGLLFADPRRFLSITDAGLKALGPDAPKPTPWVNVAAISAATAKDVTERIYVNNISAAQRSNCGKLARAAAKRNKSVPFNGGGYFERMAG